MRCPWYSNKFKIIIQVTGVYDFTYPFCEWCDGRPGRTERILDTFQKIKPPSSCDVSVIGGEVLKTPLPLLYSVLSVLRSSSCAVEVYTKGSTDLDKLSVILDNELVDRVFFVSDRLPMDDDRAKQIDPESLERWSSTVYSGVPNEECLSCRTLTIDRAGNLKFCPFLRFPVDNSYIENVLLLSSVIVGEEGSELQERAYLSSNGFLIPVADLTTLIVAYKTGNLRATARTLGKSVTLMSARMRRLSKILGNALFEGERGGSSRGGIKFTKFGMSFYRSVVGWLIRRYLRVRSSGNLYLS